MKKHTVKTIFCGLIIAVFGFFSTAALGERTAWDCPDCGRKDNTGNYCGGCAHPAPWMEDENIIMKEQIAALKEQIAALNAQIDSLTAELEAVKGNTDSAAELGFAYNFVSENGIEITGYRGKQSVLEIPKMLDGYTVLSIGNNAFENCVSLTGVTIPDGVTSIGNFAFCQCGGLTSVTIPDSVTSIGNYVFRGCSSLTSIAVSSGNRTYISLDGVLFNANMTQRITYPAGKTEKQYVIPNSVASIGFAAFEGCGGLTSVTIPNSVTSIDDLAFQCCGGLTSVTIPSSVTSIGKHAFWECGDLASVTIPTSVTSIGEHAFRGCDSLTSMTIPDSVTSIGIGAFSWCARLTSIAVSSGNESYISLDGVLFNANKTQIIIYPAGKTEKEYVIPNGVTSICNSAFEGCIDLISVTLPNSVTSIGDLAFQHCSRLISITIPDSVTSIGGSTFNGCGGNLTIHCKANSTALDYAKTHNIKYMTQ